MIQIRSGFHSRVGFFGEYQETNSGVLLILEEQYILRSCAPGRHPARHLLSVRNPARMGLTARIRAGFR